MKTAPAALAVSLFFAAGIAGGAFLRTVDTDPTVLEQEAVSPAVSLSYPPKTIAAEPAMLPPRSDGESMTAAPAALASQPESPPNAPSPVPAQKPAPRQEAAQQASTAAPAADATGNEDASKHRDSGLTGAANAIARHATKPGPAPQQRLAAAKSAPARPDRAVGAGAARLPARAEGPFQVQFGVFTSEENAERLSRALSTAQVKIDVQRGQDRGGRALFFVRSPVFDEFAQARAAASDAQVTAQAQHLGEPVKYVILRGSASAGATGTVAVSQ